MFWLLMSAALAAPGGVNANLQVWYRADLVTTVGPKAAGREWNLDVASLDQSSGHSVWRNGPLEASDAHTTPLSAWAGASVGRFSPFNFWFDGDIAEILMYDRALSCSERIAVESALATQYGLAWATDDDDDSDGVCNAVDVCVGFDDTADADGDLVPDGCDVCDGDDASGDSDSDGTCDDLDLCAGFDDAVDSDGDGVPDGCDLCTGNDASGDSDLDGVCDGDGVPDGCDVCVGADASGDSDADGWCDDIDLCAGFDDAADADGDAVPDGCDICVGADATGDSDADGVCDDLDVCAGFDDLTDGDADGVPDGCDQCPGSDDAIDGDGDGVADGCDACPGSDDTADADFDGVPDDCDSCPGFDDGSDADFDGVPDGCDTCPGFDDLLDTDGDGIPNGCDACSLPDYDGDGVAADCDLCPGFDDNVDTDGDGVPDGCDPCPLAAGEVDGDLDGAFSCVDCDDADPSVFPGAVEQVADLVDQDCDGEELCYIDGDDDGYGISATVQIPGLDCDSAEIGALISLDLAQREDHIGFLLGVVCGQVVAVASLAVDVVLEEGHCVQGGEADGLRDRKGVRAASGLVGNDEIFGTEGDPAVLVEAHFDHQIADVAHVGEVGVVGPDHVDLVDHRRVAEAVEGELVVLDGHVDVFSSADQQDRYIDGRELGVRKAGVVALALVAL